jgi:hypothetical protein
VPGERSRARAFRVCFGIIWFEFYCLIEVCDSSGSSVGTNLPSKTAISVDSAVFRVALDDLGVHHPRHLLLYSVIGFFLRLISP